MSKELTVDTNVFAYLRERSEPDTSVHAREVLFKL